MNANNTKTTNLLRNNSSDTENEKDLKDILEMLGRKNESIFDDFGILANKTMNKADFS
jgi:hypothetical protein